MTQTTKQDLAFELIELILKKEEAYNKINRLIEKEQCAACGFRCMDGQIEDSVMNLLDSVLGDEIASYFMYECSMMPNGGMITHEDGKTWRISSIKDVKDYVNREK